MTLVLASAQKQAASFGMHPVEGNRDQDPSRSEIMEGIDPLLALAGSLEGEGMGWTPTQTKKQGELPLSKQGQGECRISAQTPERALRVYLRGKGTRTD